MKRLVTIYGIILAALLLLSIVWIQSSQHLGVGPALRKLGKGNRDFAEARQMLLLNINDVSTPLLAFAANKHKNMRARTQALQILQELAYHQAIPQAGRFLGPMVRDGSRDFKLEVLQTIEKLKTTDSIQGVIDLFATATDTALFQQCFRTLGAVDSGQTAPLNNAIRSGDTTALAAICAIIEQNPIGKGVFFSELISYYRQRGNNAKAADYQKRLGLITSFWVVAPFPNSKMAAFYTPMQPEIMPFDSAQSFAPSEKQTLNWFPVMRADEEGIINLYQMVSSNQYGIAYLRTFLHVPTNRDALLLIGSDDGVRVWLNDSLVWSHKTYRATMPENDCVRIHLRQGVNRLFVKLAQDVGGWAITVRLADLHGNGMPDITAALADTLVQSPIETILQLAEKQSPDWHKKLERIDAGNDATVVTILTALLDESAASTRRQGAIAVLRALNANRLVPAGELELIELLSAQARKQADADLVEAATGALLSMNSINTLDAALALRSKPSARLALCGSLLVNSYCQCRLTIINGLTNDTERKKALAELTSLNPTDPAVVAQISALTPSAAGPSNTTSFSMPAKWITAEQFTRKDNRPVIPFPPSFDSNSLAQLSPGFTLAATTNDAPAELHLKLPRGHERSTAVLATLITADASDTIYIRLPQRSACWWNNQNLAPLFMQGTQTDDWRDDQQSVRTTGWMLYRAITRVATNELIFTFEGRSNSTQFIQAIFYTKNGHPLQSAGNALTLKGR